MPLRKLATYILTNTSGLKPSQAFSTARLLREIYSQPRLSDKELNAYIIKNLHTFIKIHKPELVYYMHTTIPW